MATEPAREILAAGFLQRTPPAAPAPGRGFATGGALDVAAPSAALAEKAEAATRDGRLAKLTDDELIGLLRAWRRLESWSSAGTLAAAAELARRRPADNTATHNSPPAAPGEFPAQLSEFISDELAAALTLSGRAASTLLDLALDLALRLPATARALREGVIDYPRARLIAEATGGLPDELSREVEARALPRAGGQTTGRLRAVLARAVLAVDPEAATRRREEALKDPRVRRWQEDAGTAALAGYALPPAEVLEADQRLTDRALALRDAGLSGSLEELRARAYLDALLGRDSTPRQVPADPAALAMPNSPAAGAATSDPAARRRAIPRRRSRPARHRTSDAWPPGST